MKRNSLTNRSRLRISLVTLVVFVSSPVGDISAAEIVVGTVEADTHISFDANSTSAGNSETGGAILGIPNTAPPEADYVYGGEYAFELRAGQDGNKNSRTSKPLIRFGLSSAIGPSTLYFLEMTTFFDGTSNDVLFLYAIDDTNNDIQNFSEGTLKWNNAPANARVDDDSWTAAGPEIGRFAAPELVDTAIRVPMFGSAIDTFVNGSNCTGNGCTTFGMTSTDSGRTIYYTKEAPGTGFLPNAAPARLITYNQIDSAANGNLTAGPTYVGGAAPTAGNLYRVLGAHTATATGPAFAGEGVIVEGTLAFSASGVDIPLIALRPGASLTESVSGDFAIGSPTASRTVGGLILDENLTLSADAGADVSINIPLRGSGNLTFNGNGAGSDLNLRFPVGHKGTITFAGTGDDVRLTGDWGIGGTLLMNSTGANRLVFDGQDSDDADDRAGTVVFNQPGTLDHVTTGVRLQGLGHMVLNADVVVDLTETPTTTTGSPAAQERRTRVERTLTGSGNISVVGPATDIDIAFDVSRNEFEIGRSDEDEMVGYLGGPPETSVISDYSGTVSTTGYVTVESHVNIPAAKVIVNNHGKFTMGFQSREESTVVIDVGEITVNSGGELVVGHLADDSDIAFQEHEPQGLRLSDDDGASGNLTLNAGSSTVMQISGLTASRQYDTIVVDGTATLGGTLELLFDPLVASPSTLPGTYTPTLGDTFDIISAGSLSLAGDFDGDGDVDDADLAQWEGDYGLNGNSDADADGDSDGADLLVWQQNLGMTPTTTGTISGTFAAVNVTDLSGGKLATEGLEFQITYSSTLVQLELVAVGPLSASAVPEPSTLCIVSLAALASLGRGRRKTA